FSFLYILEDRPSGNRFGAQRSNFLDSLPPGLNEIQIARAGSHPEGQREPFDRRYQVDRDAISRWVILDSVKDERRAGFRALVDNLRQGRQLEIPMDILDRHQLTELSDFIKPCAEVRHNSFLPVQIVQAARPREGDLSCKARRDSNTIR